eukprot:jgi/Mesen1/8503/ME000480S07855
MHAWRGGVTGRAADGGLQELELLEGDAAVYKLIGPVLVRQDLVEAQANVAKRLDYITQETKRLESTLKGLDQKHNAKRDDVLKVQQRMQQEKARLS